MTATLIAQRDVAITTATLTLVPLDHPLLASAIRSLTDRDRLHRAVMSMFPDDLPGDPSTRRAAGQILYRLDNPRTGPSRLLVQHSIPLRPEFANDPALRHADLGPLLERLSVGDHIQFRVSLNAVVSETRTKKRIAITDPGDLSAWGLSRLAAAGLGSVELSDEPRAALSRAKAPLWIAQFDGHALVTDLDRTRSAILTGMGRGRAYGCGLLSLAPVRA